jgi:hypothetical protein
MKRPRLKDYPNRLNQAGALELEKTIRKYWADRGYRIETTIEPMTNRDSKAPVFVLRSNLLNGLPRRQSKIAAQPKNSPARGPDEPARAEVCIGDQCESISNAARAARP